MQLDPQVLFNKNNQIPILENNTDEFAYQLLHLYNYFTGGLYDFNESQAKQAIYNRLEFSCLLGSICANLNHDKFFDVGCGVGISSIVYSKITKKPAIAIDQEQQFISIADYLSALLDVDIELYDLPAQDFFQDNIPNQSNLLLISGPCDSLEYYWKNLRENNPSLLLVLGKTTLPFSYGYYNNQEGIKEFMQDYLINCGYNAQHLSFENNYDVMVFLAQK